MKGVLNIGLTGSRVLKKKKKKKKDLQFCATGPSSDIHVSLLMSHTRFPCRICHHKHLMVFYHETYSYPGLASVDESLLALVFCSKDRRDERH